MAKNQNPDKVTIRSPKAKLKYPKLTEVDYGTDKYPDKDGSYNTRAVFDGSNTAVQKYLAKLDELLERSRELALEAFKELKPKDQARLKAKHGETGIVADPPYADVVDDEGEETGEIEMRFKKKAGGTRKDGKAWKASRPDLFDSAIPPKNLPKSVEIWGGSVAIIHADFEPYFVAGSGSYGIQRRLNAVQVFELVSAGGQRSASSYGFEGDEDGFDGSGLSDDDDAADDRKNGSSDDDDDDDANF